MLFQVQFKLFPLLAQSYAMRFAGMFIFQLFNKMMKNLMSANVDVTLLPLVHGLSTALKSYCTDTTADGIELARKSCGG
jgi:acyl-CoA oxidase